MSQLIAIIIILIKKPSRTTRQHGRLMSLPIMTMPASMTLRSRLIQAHGHSIWRSLVSILRTMTQPSVSMRATGRTMIRTIRPIRQAMIAPLATTIMIGTLTMLPIKLTRLIMRLLSAITIAHGRSIWVITALILVLMTVSQELMKVIGQLMMPLIRLTRLRGKPTTALINSSLLTATTWQTLQRRH